MSLVPLIVNLARSLDADYQYCLAEEFDRMLDDDFGFGINPMDIIRPRLAGHHHLTPRRSLLYAPYILSKRQRHQRDKNESPSGSSAPFPFLSKGGFQVCMDVSQFKPNELNVKTVDKTVIVEGKHEEREDDHGVIQRHFVRKYTLPKEYDPKDVVSSISSDGVLIVKAAPPTNKTVTENERIVQIQQTGPAHLNIKQTEQAPKQQPISANGAAGGGKNDASK